MGFWRDVTTRTVATLSSGLIYLYGISAGYIKTPTVRHQLVDIAYFSILLFMGIGVVLGYTGIGDKFADKRSPRLPFIIKVLLWLALIIAIASWVDMTVWRVPIWRWTSPWNNPPHK